MRLSPDNSLHMDCYVDADFAGLWGSEYDQDSICVKFRTGYIIMYQKCPIHWVSRLQTQIALSTMEAEYLALSQSMRDLIPLREILKELQTYSFCSTTTFPTTTACSKSFVPIPPSIAHEVNSTAWKDATPYQTYCNPLPFLSY